MKEAAGFLAWEESNGRMLRGYWEKMPTEQRGPRAEESLQ